MLVRLFSQKLKLVRDGRIIVLYFNIKSRNENSNTRNNVKDNWIDRPKLSI